MIELLTLIAVARTIIILLVLLYAIAELTANGERIKAEIIILMIMVVSFDFLEDLLNSYIAYWISSIILVMIISAFFCYFRREVLKTFREAAGTLNYLKEIIRYKLRMG